VHVDAVAADTDRRVPRLPGWRRR